MSKKYTPTRDKAREYYYLGRHQFSDPLYPAGTVTEIVAEFDRWYAAIEAAAEQREAIKALRSAADHLGKQGPITMSHREVYDYLNDRADRLEVDE